MLRRIRGIVGSMLVWAAPWAATATAVGLILEMQGGYQFRRLEAFAALHSWLGWAGGVGVLALGGALLGAINGALFALAVMTTHRNRAVAEIPRWHFAAIGGVATGAATGLLLGMPVAIAVAAMIPGAIGGATYLAMARRGERLASGSPHRLGDDPSRPRLARS